MKAYLTREQITERLKAQPRPSKYLTREQIRQRIQELANLPKRPKMICNAKLRCKDTRCKKHGMANGRCRLHGGLSPKASDHWNYQGRGCTKEERRKMVEENAKIKLLEMVAIELGMIPKRR